MSGKILRNPSVQGQPIALKGDVVILFKKTNTILS